MHIANQQRFSVVHHMGIWQNRYTPTVFESFQLPWQATWVAACISPKLYKHKCYLKHSFMLQIDFLPFYARNISDCVLGSEHC